MQRGALRIERREKGDGAGTQLRRAEESVDHVLTPRLVGGLNGHNHRFRTLWQYAVANELEGNGVEVRAARRQQSVPQDGSDLRAPIPRCGREVWAKEGRARGPPLPVPWSFAVVQARQREEEVPPLGGWGGGAEIRADRRRLTGAATVPNPCILR